MAAGASWDGGRTLQDRLNSLSETLRASSQERKQLEDDTQKIVRDGIKQALLGGRDENGRAFTPLAKSTRKQRRERGVSGDIPFITRGENSTIITSLRHRWRSQGESTRILETWWDVPWLKYHWSGAKKANSRWRLPQRRPGMPPEVNERVQELHSQFVAKLRKTLAG